MAPKPTNRGRAERIRINLDDPHEVAYWSRRFGCTAPELEEAVQTVGAVAQSVCTLIARRTRSGD